MSLTKNSEVFNNLLDNHRNAVESFISCNCELLYFTENDFNSEIISNSIYNQLLLDDEHTEIDDIDNGYLDFLINNATINTIN